MANRVTSEEVLEIIDTDLTNISAFIIAANLIITDRLNDAGLSDDHLKEIERWLSAHFIAIRDPKIRSEATDDAQAAYEIGNLGKGLEFTSFGQQVLVLDTTGKMKAIGLKRAMIEVIDFEDV